MITTDQRQFALYVVTELLNQIARATNGEARLISELANNYPDLNVRDLVTNRDSRRSWNSLCASTIVDHFAEQYFRVRSVA